MRLEPNAAVVKGRFRGVPGVGLAQKDSCRQITLEGFNYDEDDNLNKEFGDMKRKQWESASPCRMLLVTLLGCLLVLATARAQDPDREKGLPKACTHGGYELWDQLRVLPVHFTEFTGDTAWWKYQDAHTVKLGSFVLRQRAIYVSRENKDVKALYLMERKGSDWLCYYCSHCNALLAAYELKPGSPKF